MADTTRYVYQPPQGFRLTVGLSIDTGYYVSREYFERILSQLALPEQECRDVFDTMLADANVKMLELTGEPIRHVAYGGGSLGPAFVAEVVGEDRMVDDDEVDLDDTSDNEWDSGPFCRHWGDPADCEEPCGRCGHQCSQHGSGECRAEYGECRPESCGCEGFVDEKSAS